MISGAPRQVEQVVDIRPVSLPPLSFQSLRRSPLKSHASYAAPSAALLLLGISRIVEQGREADASVPKLRESDSGWISGVEVGRGVVWRKQDK